MTSKILSINYTEYASVQELQSADRELVEAAIEARKASYSPYSKFSVGAAVRLEDGTIVRGANQENAAYPSGLCAERTAMFAAGAAYPDLAMEAIALVGGAWGETPDAPATPCGSCRQVMAEYQMKSGRPMKVFLIGKSRILAFDKVDDLLPFIFDTLKV